MFRTLVLAPLVYLGSVCLMVASIEYFPLKALILRCFFVHTILGTHIHEQFEFSVKERTLTTPWCVKRNLIINTTINTTISMVNGITIT